MASEIRNGVLIKFNENDSEGNGLDEKGHFEGSPDITEIGPLAFENCINLITASFPQVTKIHMSAFEDCIYLKRIMLPKVIYIESFAFSHCIRLAHAIIPQKAEISNYAFKGCTFLTALTFSSQAVFGTDALGDCNKLSRLIINDIYHPADIRQIRKQLPSRLKNIEIQLISKNTGLIQQVLTPYLIPEARRHILNYSYQLGFFKLPAVLNIQIPTQHTQDSLLATLCALQ